MNAALLIWADEGHRLLARRGGVEIGAVFPPRIGKHWRWRAWVTACHNAVDGAARSEEEAKQKVESRFAALLELAHLTAGDVV